MTRLTMRRADIAVAMIVVLIWGLNFVAMKVALRGFTPMQLGAVRYLFAALPLIFVIRRPQLPPWWVVLYGLVQGLGQFGLLFLALKAGMTSALASVLMQTQVFFTAILAYGVLHEKPNRPTMIAMLLAGAGLLCFAANAAGATAAITLSSLMLNLGAAAMWGASNVIARHLQRRMPSYSALQFVVWASLPPIVPFIALSLYVDGTSAWQGLPRVAFASWAAAACLGWFATVAAYGLWTRLLKQYPANRIAPFSLGVPVIGLVAGVVMLGEAITAWQSAGIGFVGVALLYLLFGR